MLVMDGLGRRGCGGGDASDGRFGLERLWGWW